MSTRRLYVTCVGSYLTGWVISQAVYNRVRKHVVERDWEKYKQDLAEAVAEEMEARRDPLDSADETTELLAAAIETGGPLTIAHSMGRDQHRVAIGRSGRQHAVEGYGDTLPEALRRAALVTADW